MNINKAYYLTVIINTLILPIIFLASAYKQYCYITGNYKERIMRIEKCINGSGSKMISNSIEGNINNQEVSFGLYDQDAYDFYSYLDDNDQDNLKNINYDNLKVLNLYVRVIQFGNSENVLYIKKHETLKESLARYLHPWMSIEIISISLLLIFYSLKKYNEKKI
ncbi:hypothetical protein B4N84_08380 [Flavobacterium sp. IR1]|nr:hypothetical protein B4N84_08380 [Flavobacterium sp. IR1]